MEVNGEAFRKAREEIRKEAGFPIGSGKMPAKGTQEWLAGVAQVRGKNGKLRNPSVRTIQMLEKGEASLQTIDAVSTHLGIIGRELIIGYGKDGVTVSAPNVIDFRPVTNPYNNKDTFYKDKFVITIDPLIINFSSEDIYCVTVEKIRLKLFIDEFIIDFSWKYEVSLTPNSNGWLGYKDSVHNEVLNNPSIWRKSIMFNQVDDNPTSWIEFIECIRKTPNNAIKLESTIDFTNFQKKIIIGLSTLELKNYIDCSIKNGGVKLLIYMQPKSLTF